MKGYYYRFWIQTSGQSEASIVRYYPTRSTKDVLAEDTEQWAKRLPFYGVSESWTIGATKLTKSQLPKNRRELCKQWAKVCLQYRKIAERKKLTQQLFNVPPYQ
jgi:hypothetical protein